MLGCCGMPWGVNPNDKTVMINPPGAYHNGGVNENLTPAKTCLLLSHLLCLLLGSVHIEGMQMPTPTGGGTTVYYLTRFFAQKCIRMKEFGLDGGILSPR